MSPDECPVCEKSGRKHVVCRECGAHFLTILRDDDLCFDCTEAPS